MPTRILLLQQSDRSPPGTLLEFLSARAVEVHHINVGAGDRVPQSSAPFDGAVVLGGPMAAWEDAAHPHLPQVVALLQDCISNEVPVLAICLGSQLLARAGGARNYKANHTEIGWHPMDLTAAGHADALLAGMPKRFPVFLWHSDGFDLPDGATALARTDKWPLQVFRLRGRQWGVLFHPEKTAAIIDEQLARNRRALAEKGPPFDPDLISTETDQFIGDYARRATRIFDNFLAVCRG